MIFGLFRPREDSQRVHAIYAEIVAQARQPAFYSHLGVPDTLEGRYEMLMLHAFLYMHRLKDEAAPVKDMAQKVFDLMFSDMDRSLRELGVGDLTVPKKIKKMAQAFYGRAAAYDAALDGNDGALVEAVLRNVFSDEASAKANADAVAAYVWNAAKVLAEQGAEALINAGPVFPAPVSVEVGPVAAEKGKTE
jgi:cytochrome b pre-mRNA-processing protein 3